MKLTAHDAARNVTGTKHMLTVAGKRYLLDCGLVQGRRSESERRNRNLPFEPGSIEAVIQSHAHVDHSGSLPTLVKLGFRGRIYATSATADLCEHLLRDTAHIQEHDLEYLNRRRRKRGEAPLEPIYTQQDVEATLERFTPVKYDEPVRVSRDVTATWRDAGHILGAAVLEIDALENRRRVRIVFTGDLGRDDMPILRNVYRPRSADVLITESTYGNRGHSPMSNVKDEFAEFVSDVARKRGKIVVPAFALGRTQQIIYMLHGLIRERRIPEIPVYVDSPLAVSLTDVFRRHPECFDNEMDELLKGDDDPLGFSRLIYTRSVQESKNLNERPGPMMILSASGMCEAGRVLHHLKNTVADRRNAVMIVGYQAEHTLGRRIVERSKRVNILGKEYPLRARVKVFNEFSAHADRDELLRFARGMRRGPRKTIVVHGQEEASLAYARLLTRNGFPNVSVPYHGESVEL
jgi:metallo-beta-lactamase family protein